MLQCVCLESNASLKVIVLRYSFRVFRCGSLKGRGVMGDVIFSSTVEENALRLENVLQRFDKVNLQLHPGKCVFAQSKVQYLGCVV